MSYNKIQNIFKTKTTLICLSSGQYEKIYLEKILEDKDLIYYHNNGERDKEIVQLVKQHEKDNSIGRVIDGICKDICDIIKSKLNDQLSFGNQNSDYLVVIITDHDRAPLYSFDELKNEINAEINRIVSLKLEIRSVINAVQDHDERLLLKYRYLNFMQWDDICEHMQVSMRTAHRIHAAALANVQIPKS